MVMNKPAYPANHIRIFRKKLGLTIEKFAEITGYSSQLIAKLETGERRLNTTHLERFSKALQCEPWELFDDGTPFNSEDIELFKKIRHLPKSSKQAIHALVAGLEGQNTKND